MHDEVDPMTGMLTVTNGDRVAKVALLRVPGRDGRGAYMGEILITGVCTDEMPLRGSITDSIRDLGDALERHRFGTRPISLPATLMYGGAWAPGALESQVEYDPLKDPRVSEACRRFFNLLWANLPGEWTLKPMMHPKGLAVECRSPMGLTTAVYDMGILARAADSGDLDMVAMAASRMFLKPPAPPSYKCSGCSRELPGTPSAGRCPGCAEPSSIWDRCGDCGLPHDGPPDRSCIC